MDTNLSHFIECPCCIAQSTLVIGHHSGVSSKINIHQLNLYPRMCTFDGKLVFHSSNNLISYDSPLMGRDATRTRSSCLGCGTPCESAYYKIYPWNVWKNGLLWDQNDLILAILTSNYITYIMKTPCIHIMSLIMIATQQWTQTHFQQCHFVLNFLACSSHCSVCSYQIRSKISAL